MRDEVPNVSKEASRKIAQLYDNKLRINAHHGKRWPEIFWSTHHFSSHSALLQLGTHPQDASANTSFFPVRYTLQLKPYSIQNHFHRKILPGFTTYTRTAYIISETYSSESRMSATNEASSKRSREEDAEGYSSGEESSEGEGTAAPDAAGSRHEGAKTGTLEKLKRDKRLAMNRESARARRSRKKMRMETLEHRAEELNQRHHALVLENQGLKARVAQLETELSGSRPLGGGGGAASMLQQQALMAARMGGASSLGLPFGLAGAGGMGTDPELQYLQMQMQMQMQMRSSNAGTSAAGGGGSTSERAARLAAMQDIQSQLQTNQYSALSGSAGGGQLSDIGRLNAVRS